MKPIETLTETITSNNKSAMESLLHDKQHADILNNHDIYARLLSFAQRYNFNHSADVLIQQRKQPYFFPDSVLNAIDNENTVMLNFYRENEGDRLDDFIAGHTSELCLELRSNIGPEGLTTSSKFTAFFTVLTAGNWAVLINSDGFFDRVVKNLTDEFKREHGSYICDQLSFVLSDVTKYKYDVIDWLTTLSLYTENKAFAIRLIDSLASAYEEKKFTFEKRQYSYSYRSHLEATKPKTYFSLFNNVLKNFLSKTKTTDIKLSCIYIEHIMEYSDVLTSPQHGYDYKLQGWICDILLPFHRKGGDIFDLITNFSFSRNQLKTLYTLAYKQTKISDDTLERLADLLFDGYNNEDSNDYQSGSLRNFVDNLLESSKDAWKNDEKFSRYCKLADRTGSVDTWLPEKRKNTVLNIQACLETEKYKNLALYAMLQQPLVDIFTPKFYHTGTTINTLLSKYDFSELLESARNQNNEHATRLLLEQIAR